jgi:uncharacterized protein (DUF952 family)
VIYKLLLPTEWARFRSAGYFEGSALDTSSGFVHCSSRAQLAATAGRYFRDEPTLIVVALDDSQLTDVRWEAAAGGELFPHVYGPLTATAVVATYQLAGAASTDEVVPWMPGYGPGAGRLRAP